VAPPLTLQTNGASLIPVSSGGYGVALEAVTTVTNGTWIINTYSPDGTLVGQVTAPVASVGQDVLYNDGGTPDTIYPYPYYDVEVIVDPANTGFTNIIRVYLLPPRLNAGAITGYDQFVLPANNTDKQFVLSVLQDGESGMASFIYQTIDFGDGNWKVAPNPTAISLNQNWGWTALQAGLAGADYRRGSAPGEPLGWHDQHPDRPISFLAVHSHGGSLSNSDTVIGLQGPSDMNDTAVTQQSLEGWGFNKESNAVAIAIFTGCQLGNGPFMQFILRNKGAQGQINSATAQALDIRPCFGLGWTVDVRIGTDQFQWMSYFTFFATEFGNGPNNSPFEYTLDGAFGLVPQYYQGNGGQGVTWCGTAGMTLDRFAH